MFPALINVFVFGSADENKNKRQNEVYGCDLGDIWFNVGETWGDGCSEPFCECMPSGEVECEMNGPGCEYFLITKACASLPLEVARTEGHSSHYSALKYVLH